MKFRRSFVTLASIVSASSLLGACSSDRGRSSSENTDAIAARLGEDASAPIERSHPYEDALNQGFGAGYHPLTGLSPTVDCAFTDEPARCEGGDCKERWTFRVEPVSGHAELLDKLNVSSAGRADVSSLARLAKTRFASLTTMDAYQVGVLVSARHTVRELSVPAGSRSLNPDYEALLAEDAAAFTSACGTELPMTLVDGDELFAFFPVRTESEVGLAWMREQLAALSGSWEVRVNAKPNDPRGAALERAAWQTYQAGIASSLRGIRQVAHNRGYQLSRVAGKNGPREVQDTLVLEDLKTTLDSFGLRPSDAQPLFLEGTFARYDRVFPGLEAFATAFDFTPEETKLQEHANALLAVEDALASARYIPQVPVLFPNVDPATIERRLGRLTAFETSLRTEIEACAATRSTCATLAAPPPDMRVLERLPAYPPPVLVSPNFCTGAQSCFAGASPGPGLPKGLLLVMDGTSSPGLLGRFVSLTIGREGNVEAGEAFDVPEKYKGYCSGARAQRTCAFADMNGDGTPDVVSAGGVSGGTRVYLSTAADAGIKDLGASRGWGRLSGVSVSYAQAVGDVSGDGMADLVTFDPNGVAHVMTSDGTKLNASAPWVTGLGGAGTTYRVGDVDGDRRADVIAIAENGTSLVAFSTGTSFKPPVAGGDVGCRVVAACKAPACLPERCELADVNGDGRVDAVAIHRDGRVTTAFGGADGFQAPRLWTDGFCRNGEPECLVADMNGDGRADLISFVKSSVAGDPETTAAGDVHVTFAPGYSQR